MVCCGSERAMSKAEKILRHNDVSSIFLGLEMKGFHGTPASETAEGVGCFKDVIIYQARSILHFELCKTKNFNISSTLHDFDDSSLNCLLQVSQNECNTTALFCADDPSLPSLT